ncbi:MAG: hypothetical protein HUU35_01885 [Armatimonadetes bacterium]|nr:hypothetical protein [Armatimonadota bacterium]
MRRLMLVLGTATLLVGGAFAASACCQKGDKAACCTCCKDCKACCGDKCGDCCKDGACKGCAS